MMVVGERPVNCRFKPAAPPLAERRSRDRGRAEGAGQLAVHEQVAIRGHPGAVEFELRADVHQRTDLATMALETDQVGGVRLAIATTLEATPA
jgi:hypothetical protein